MASGHKQQQKNAPSWIPTSMNCGSGYHFDDDSSIVDSIPVSPIPQKDNNLFGFSMGQFLSPIISCVEPNLQTMCVAPDFPSSSLFCHGAESRRPDVLAPKPVRRSTPNPNDVICGKGHNQSTHQGNRNLRDLVAANQDMYGSLTKKEKQNMSRQIVGLILLHTVPTGRFLAWESSSGMFVDVGLSRSIEKTNQGFRDALFHSNKSNNRDDQHRPKQHTNHHQRASVHIPDHLAEVYSNIPRPQDFLHYPELMDALKGKVNIPMVRHHPSPIPGPFPATRPNKCPAIVSPRQYLPSSVRLVPRHSSTTARKNLELPPGLITPNNARGHELPSGPVMTVEATSQTRVESSPRRIHDWKRRRTGDNGVENLNCSFESNNSLTEAMESRLTLHERVVRSPIRSVPKMTRNLNISADSTDGQAALAATAFLRLDDSF